LVNVEENYLLTAPYLEEEGKKAILQIEHNKAPDPDGFPANFYITSGKLLNQTFLSCLAF
jgi:hypothetical protein